MLVTVHAPRPWQDPNNSIFAAAAQTHPNTTLADWHAAASEHPEWLYPDGTHVRPEYAYQYAEIVKAAALGLPPRRSEAGGRRAGLAEAEDELRVLGHQLGRPRRVERRLGLDVLNPGTSRTTRSISSWIIGPTGHAIEVSE